MVLATKIAHLPLGLLVASLASASPARIARRDPSYDILGGHNFPDPSILTVDGVTYIFGTNDGAGNDIPMVSSSDFSNPTSWSGISNAFPPTDVPAFSNWASAGTVWAPDVNQLNDYDGSFAMYYAAALQSNPDVHCLGVARSLTVGGPYNDSSTEPWICPESDGGAIDASGFVDADHSRFVVYKIDGPAANGGGYCNSPSKTSPNTSIMLQQTQSDGYTLMGDPAVLYNNDGVDDKYNIEAPSILKAGDGTYFLFFSSGCTSDDSYSWDYITSTSGIFGPYANRQTLLSTGGFGEFGPGGADVATDGTGMAAWHSLSVDNDISKPRVLNTGSISLSGLSASIS